MHEIGLIVLAAVLTIAFAACLAVRRWSRPAREAAAYGSFGEDQYPDQDDEYLTAILDDTDDEYEPALGNLRREAKHCEPAQGHPATTPSARIPALSALSARLEEDRLEWHYAAGRLTPPTGLTDRLPDGSWLKELLLA